MVTADRGGGGRAVGKVPRHHRPLSRTQSSPLPQSPQALPHGALQHHLLDKQQGKVRGGGGGCGVGMGMGWDVGWRWEWGGMWGGYRVDMG